MFPDHHIPYDRPERPLRPDRRPLPRAANEIRLCVKRAASHDPAAHEEA